MLQFTRSTRVSPSDYLAEAADPVSGGRKLLRDRRNLELLRVISSRPAVT